MTPKVLIAEDETEVLSALAEWMKQAGFEPIIAEDGETALAKAKAEHPSVILMDVMLPKLNGWEVCQQLKHDPAYKQIPIILLSALIREESGHDELDLADAHLPKPLRPEQIVAKIRDLLSRQHPAP